MAERLVALDARVAEVRLFGSLAKGNYAARSDADICIILAGDDARRMIDRLPEFHDAFRGASVPVDVLVYTGAEMDQMRDEGRRFAAEIDTRSIVLARSAPAGGATDQPPAAIQSLDPNDDDSLIDDLLASNPEFQPLVSKSKASARKPFRTVDQRPGGA